MTANINIKKLKDSAVIPTYGSEWAAGADLYACLDTPTTILPGNTVFIPTGIALEIPVGYAGLIYARSGLSCKQGLAPANKVGVIDADYRGEIIVALHNHGEEVVDIPLDFKIIGNKMKYSLRHHSIFNS